MKKIYVYVIFSALCLSMVDLAIFASGPKSDECLEQVPVERQGFLLVNPALAKEELEDLPASDIDVFEHEPRQDEGFLFVSPHSPSEPESYSDWLKRLGRQVVSFGVEKASEYYTLVKNETSSIALVGFKGLITRGPSRLKLIEPYRSETILHSGDTIIAKFVNKVHAPIEETINLRGYRTITLEQDAHNKIKVIPSKNVQGDQEIEEEESEDDESSDEPESYYDWLKRLGKQVVTFGVEKVSEYYTLVKNNTPHIALVGFKGLITRGPSRLKLIEPYGSATILHSGDTIVAEFVAQNKAPIEETINLRGYRTITLEQAANNRIKATPSK